MKNIEKVAQEIIKQSATTPPNDQMINWKNFSLQDDLKEDFGAALVNFYGSLGFDSIKIKKNVDYVLSMIKKGANQRLKYLTRH